MVKGTTLYTMSSRNKMEDEVNPYVCLIEILAADCALSLRSAPV